MPSRAALASLAAILRSRETTPAATVDQLESALADVEKGVRDVGEAGRLAVCRALLRTGGDRLAISAAAPYSSTRLHNIERSIDAQSADACVAISAAAPYSSTRLHNIEGSIDAQSADA
jgi:hypothetical protein